MSISVRTYLTLYLRIQYNHVQNVILYGYIQANSRICTYIVKDEGYKIENWILPREISTNTKKVRKEIIIKSKFCLCIRICKNQFCFLKQNYIIFHALSICYTISHKKVLNYSCKSLIQKILFEFYKIEIKIFSKSMSLKIIIKYKSRSRIFFTLYVKKKKYQKNEIFPLVKENYLKILFNV